MNEPIISPWLIYFAEIACSIEGFCMFVCNFVFYNY